MPDGTVSRFTLAKALEEKKAKAHRTINGLADGSIQPEKGQTVFDAMMQAGEAGGINAATNERTADILAAHKPLNRGEKTQFIASSSPDSYTTLSFTTRAEADKAGAVQVSAKQREGFLAPRDGHEHGGHKQGQPCHPMHCALLLLGFMASRVDGEAPTRSATYTPASNLANSTPGRSQC